MTAGDPVSPRTRHAYTRMLRAYYMLFLVRSGPADLNFVWAPARPFPRRFPKHKTRHTGYMQQHSQPEFFAASPPGFCFGERARCDLAEPLAVGLMCLARTGERVWCLARGMRQERKSSAFAVDRDQENHAKRAVVTLTPPAKGDFVGFVPISFEEGGTILRHHPSPRSPVRKKSVPNTMAVTVVHKDFDKLKSRMRGHRKYTYRRITTNSGTPVTMACLSICSLDEKTKKAAAHTLCPQHW